MKRQRQCIITNGIAAWKSWGFLSEALGKLALNIHSKGMGWLTWDNS